MATIDEIEESESPQKRGARTRAENRKNRKKTPEETPPEPFSSDDKDAAQGFCLFVLDGMVKSGIRKGGRTLTGEAAFALYGDGESVKGVVPQLAETGAVLLEKYNLKVGPELQFLFGVGQLVMILASLPRSVPPPPSTPPTEGVDDAT